MSISPADLSAGVYLIDKPEGITSFDALSPVKKKVGHGKVGHAGTLDKFASGLLIVLIGPYTKLNSLLSDFDKTYTGTIRFGETSTTLDPEGELTAVDSVPDFDTIKRHLSEFVGRIRQIPPKYSAVHVGGDRAYKKARKGEEVEIPSREVSVHSFRPLAWKSPDLDFSVTCSKGTYVRSLARDLGEACGSGAYLTALRRNSIGPFDTERAVSADEFDPGRHRLSDEEVLAAIPGLISARVDSEYRKKISHGTPIRESRLTNAATDGPIDFSEHAGPVGVLDHNDRLAALCDYKNEKFSYRFVIPEGGTK